MKTYSVLLLMALAGMVGSASAQTYVYDDVGRLSKVLYPNGKGVAYTYDVRDNLTQISPITIPPAVTNVSIVALSQTQAQVTWQFTGTGFVFLVQSQVVGTDDWINGASVDISLRTATVSVQAGVPKLFRIVVIGATQGVESVPSDPVQLPSAVPLIVTTVADENNHALGAGSGDSLREVIEAAIPGDVINFAPALTGETIVLGGTQLNVDKNLTIDASALPEGIKIDAAGRSRVFAVSIAKTVIIKGLTITGGNSGFGGGVNNDGVALSLLNCVVSGNQSGTFETPGVGFGGGVYNSHGGSLNVADTTFSDNSADEGGGIYNAADGSLAVDFSTFARNGATFGPGGGVANRGAPFSVKRTTFLENSAYAFPGNPVTPVGGGIFNTGATGVIENCTLSGNTSSSSAGGGISNNGTGNLILRHCTIADNIGGGVFNNAPAVLTLDNTIVANNFRILNSAFDFQGNYTAVGANVLRIHTGTQLGGPAPLTSDPLLGPPGSYGGRNRTMPPLVGSPVIDAGVASADTPSTDQESSLRPFGPAPDIGAIESRLSAITDLAWLTTSAGSLNPTFRSSLTTYTATVPHTVTTAAVRAAIGQFGQTMQVRINGGSFSALADKEASAQFPLNPGENPVEVKVTAQNGTTTKTYTLTVIRGAPSANNANLASLATTSGALSPAFNAAETSYDTFVPNATTSTTVTATTANAMATIQVRSNLGAFISVASGAASPPLALEVGANAIDVKVTAKDGATTAIYTITATREAPALSNANLSALATNAGALSPGFSRGLFFYSVGVSDQIASATVTASPVEGLATMVVRANGGAFSTLTSGVASAPLALNGGVNLLEVKVTAQDGATVKSYTIIVTRTLDDIEWASKRRLAPAAAGDNRSRSPSISSDGRFVAFSSDATNLVASDTNNAEDVFVFDRVLLVVERVSVNNAGQEATYNGSGGGNAESRNPSISADGRYVAFQSRANNLVPNDTNGQSDASFGGDIFVYDRTAKTIERVSLRDTGGESNGASETPSISGDGRYVAFASGANNLVAGYANGEVNVYIHDRTTDTIVGVSVPLGAFSANRSSLNPAFSRDGNFVAFEFSVDKSVDSTPGYQYRDIYLYSRATGAVTRITGTKVGLEAHQTDSRSPSISADGRYIVFQSNLEDLDFYDTNSAVDVFVYDQTDGHTRVASVNSAGNSAGLSESINPSISGDGRYVAFESRAINLVTPNTNGNSHIFMKELATGGITVLSLNSAAAQADGDSSFPSVSFDGRNAAFESLAANLATGDNNSVSDVFVAATQALAPGALADLASLASNLGALSPGFSPGVTSYSVSVAGGVDAALVRPVPADPDATVEARVNAGAFTPLAAGAVSSIPLEVGVNVIDIKVTASDPSTTKTYTLSVTRVPIVPAVSSNADLAGVVPSVGVLSPVFDSNTAVYSVDVPNNTTSMTIKPTVAQANAIVKVNDVTVASGANSGAISLSIGSNTIITTVTAQDGFTTKTYALAVTREPNSNADLAGLVPSAGTLAPAFATGTTTYTASVTNLTTTITLTPTLVDSTATVTVQGLTVASGSASTPINLNVGPNVIDTVVTAQNGTVTKTYMLTVTRAPGTPEIAVEQPAGIDIADGGTRGFGTVSVGGSTSLTFTIKNTGTADLTGLTITKDGTHASDFTVTANPTAPVSGPSGSTTFTIQFAPAAATARTAAVHIASNDSDESPFDINLTGTGSATPAPEIAVEQPAGTNIAHGGTKDFGSVAVGANASLTFTIKNTGNADLTGLTITKDGAHASEFTVTASPTAPVTGPSGSTTFTIQFAPAAAGARTAAIHIASNDSDENPFDINLTGGTAFSTDANLANLVLSAGTLTPAFSAATTSYTASVPDTTTSITVTPTVAASAATVKVNGVTVTSGSASNSINLNVGPNVVSTVITAQDTTTTKPYTITVTRGTPPVFSPELAGSYLGLLAATASSPLPIDHEGLVKISVVRTGTFSGSVKLGGLTIGLSGRVLADGGLRFGRLLTPTFELVRKIGGVTTSLGFLELTLDTAAGADRITGKLTQGATTVAELAHADRALYTSKKNPALPLLNVPITLADPLGNKGKYTALFRHGAAPNNGVLVDGFPQGEGWAIVTLATTGNVTVTGQLADGSALSYSGALSKTNELPVYAPLYLLKRGFLSGRIVFDPVQAPTDASAVGMKWFKPANTKDTRYPLGWSGGITTDLAASKFLVPLKPTTTNPAPLYVLGTHNILGLVGAPAPAAITLLLVDGGTPGFARTGTVDAKHKVTIDGLVDALTLKATFAATTGKLTGSFKHPVSNKTVTYSGVVFQKTNTAGGYFLYFPLKPTGQPAPSGLSGSVGIAP